MKILFELNHPAHYHLFINAATELSMRHEVAFVVKQKDVLLKLFNSQSNYIIYNRKNKEKKSGVINNVIWMLESDLKTLIFTSTKFRPDILIGSNFTITHIGKILNKPSFVCQEDDLAVSPQLGIISYPLATRILTPKVCDMGKWEFKQVQYCSYHELAYLSPKYFKPDKNKIKVLRPDEKPYCLLRMSSLAAYHDIGKMGLTNKLVEQVIDILDNRMNLYILSERELKGELSNYQFPLDPKEIHHALYYASLYLGDSQTMAAEAAVLGTPAIRFNDFIGKIGYLDELEKKYKLCIGISTDQKELLFDKISQFVFESEKVKKEWKAKCAQMLQDKIELTDFLVWFIENFPDSDKILKNNPNYQYKFKIQT